MMLQPAKRTDFFMNHFAYFKFFFNSEFSILEFLTFQEENENSKKSLIWIHSKFLQEKNEMKVSPLLYWKFQIWGSIRNI